jgi:hypothetical protein
MTSIEKEKIEYPAIHENEWIFPMTETSASGSVLRSERRRVFDGDLDAWMSEFGLPFQSGVPSEQREHIWRNWEVLEGKLKHKMHIL